MSLTVRRENGRLVDREIRMQDGSWAGSDGPRNTRVSGVLMVNNLRPSRLARVTWTQYLNPWCRYPLGDHIQDVTSGRVVEEQLVSHNGTMPREIFGLTEDWPE